MMMLARQDRWSEVRVVGALGHGAFGSVHRCCTPQGPRAIKTIRCPLSGVAKARTQAREEVKAHERCSASPFVASLFWAHETPMNLHLCIELCEGGDLYDLMTTHPPDSVEARLLLAEIAMGLRFIHKQGVLYNDLKPENVVLTATGHARLIDFGLAVTTESAAELKAANIITTHGTLQYAAPEVLMRAPHGVESDWWAFGVVAHELLTGQLPFDADDVGAVANLICSHRDLMPTEGLESGEAAYDLVNSLLQVARPERLGFEGARDGGGVINHDFFRDVDVIALRKQDRALGEIAAAMRLPRRRRASAKPRRASLAMGDLPRVHGCC